MANFSTWSRSVPSGASLQREFDDLYRSDKSILEEALNSEHYFESSFSTAAGAHRLGSARVYMGTRSQLSVPLFGNGRLMFCSDTSSLHVLGPGSSSITTISAPSLHDSRYVARSGASMTSTLDIQTDDNALLWSNASGANRARSQVTGASSAAQLNFDILAPGGSGWSSIVSLNHTNGLSVYGGKVWTSANDGAGSGLDADTVDGVDLMSATTAWDPGSISAGNVSTISLAVTGAVEGDCVAIGNSFNADSGLLVLDAYVSSADVVTVVLKNLTAGAINPSSRTIRVAVIGA